MALPGVLSCEAVVASGGGLVVGLAFGDVGADVDGVVAQVLADAESGRSRALLVPLVDGLFGHLEHHGDVVGGEVVCASTPMGLEEYADSVGDARMVIDMIVGALQRVLVFPGLGLAIEQAMPDEVVAAYERLRDQGFTSRLIPDVAQRT